MDTETLMSSLSLVDDDEDGLTLRFYEILFERYPAVRPLFSRDVRPQAAMLRQAIVAVLEHLDDSAWLGTNLAALGAKHAGYGVTEPMYAAVGECMIAAMQERGGQEWTLAMTDAWTEALTAVSQLMLAGHPSEEELAS
ncbi:flavoprotein [Skermania sp. ID1734]|uniref:globin domain-containing protein n=1 Tax=Skermania sp. ID1734 TaxID=2597516 RepID=UPI00117FF956|nr:globin domain-containing protein [Skermania sp. ID1734]TSD93552.1 flavoprotein [Skermania sp. ID1734]